MITSEHKVTKLEASVNNPLQRYSWNVVFRNFVSVYPKDLSCESFRNSKFISSWIEVAYCLDVETKTTLFSNVRKLKANLRTQ